VSGKELCAAHDPETRARAQQAGGNAKAEARKASFLSRAEAEDIIRLRLRADVPGTIEAVARKVACGELATATGNAVLVAANTAIHAIDSVDKATKIRASAMTDDELDEAIETEIAERLRRRSDIGATQ
jgi:aspartate/glutamate racemase